MISAAMTLRVAQVNIYLALCHVFGLLLIEPRSEILNFDIIWQCVINIQLKFNNVLFFVVVTVQQNIHVKLFC